MLERGVEGDGLSGRRLGGPTDGSDNGVYRAGRLEIRPADHAAFADGRPLPLTVRELALLSELARNSERILTREQLFEAVWGRERRAADRSVDVYVSRLRTKLAAALPGIEFIHTHFGIGYRFAPESAPKRR
jgi:DNA-binding response OmpR family regulator